MHSKSPTIISQATTLQTASTSSGDTAADAPKPKQSLLARFYAGAADTLSNGSAGRPVTLPGCDTKAGMSWDLLMGMGQVDHGMTFSSLSVRSESKDRADSRGGVDADPNTEKAG